MPILETFNFADGLNKITLKNQDKNGPVPKRRTDHSKNEFKSSSSIVIVSIIMHTKSTDALGLLSILALVFNLLSRRNIFIHTVVTINSIVN